MKILITGAGGQLGKDCVTLLGSKYNVQGCDSRQLNISDQDQVENTIKDVQPEVVINCAAYTAVDACESEKKTCELVNATGAENLARSCQKNGCRLFHISTDYVFDGNKPVPGEYTEQDPTSPLSAYGHSKLRGEKLIAANMDDYLIIRTAWLYGMGGKNFLKTMLRLALADPQRTITVVNDQYGSLTWTATLARQLSQLLSSDITGIVHATAEQYCTWYEGAIYFLKAMDVPFALTPCTTEQYPTPAHRPTNSILANNKLKKCGLHVMQTWQQDIDNFVAEYRNELLAEAKATA
jgi:dTDP-4-dehydrorhamnose reductase